MNLTLGQKQFISEFEKGSNIFLTGKAGTGKSFVINQIKNITKLGSTGISAINIGGKTMHSHFWIPVKPNKVLSYNDCYYYSDDKKNTFTSDPILFDECSMIRSDQMQAVEWTLNKNTDKKAHNKWSLTDNQIIFVGDMKQLPPVVKDNREELCSIFGGTKFYHSDIVKKLNVKKIELTEIIRQSDPEFIDALNILREGNTTPYWKKLTSSKIKDGIILCPKNITVQKHNQRGLSKLKTKEIVFQNYDNGTLKLWNFNLPESITLKDGCRIMYRYNSKDYPLVNGTMGTFRIVDGEYCIETDDGKLYPIKYEEFLDITKPKYGNEEVKGYVRFFPVSVAYAITIHKSQGLTFDKVNVDLSDGYFGGSTLFYVAFSRCTSPNGLNIIM